MTYESHVFVTCIGCLVDAKYDWLMYECVAPGFGAAAGAGAEDIDRLASGRCACMSEQSATGSQYPLN